MEEEWKRFLRENHPDWYQEMLTSQNHDLSWRDKLIQELKEKLIRLEAEKNIRAKQSDLGIEALHEIYKAKGCYSQDRLTHATNTIEDMQKLALEALRKLGTLGHEERYKEEVVSLTRYYQALESGLSDAEAREEGWPSKQKQE